MSGVRVSLSVPEQYDKFENNPALSETTFPLVERSLFIHFCHRAWLLSYKKAAWFYYGRADLVSSLSELIDAGVFLELSYPKYSYISKPVRNN